MCIFCSGVFLPSGIWELSSTISEWYKILLKRFARHQRHRLTVQYAGLVVLGLFLIGLLRSMFPWHQSHWLTVNRPVGDAPEIKVLRFCDPSFHAVTYSHCSLRSLCVSFCSCLWLRVGFFVTRAPLTCHCFSCYMLVLSSFVSPQSKSACSYGGCPILQLI